MNNYSPEEAKDITTRVEQAFGLLKELNLTPSAQVSTVAIGNDVFATKVEAFLKDTKYGYKV